MTFVILVVRRVNMKDSSKTKNKKERKTPIFIIAFVGTLALVCAVVALFNNRSIFDGNFNALINNRTVIEDGSGGKQKTCSNIAGCTSYGSDCTCKSCGSSYNLSGGRCVLKNTTPTPKCPDISHCKAYVNDKTKCACGICESGYSLSSDGKCILKETSSTCSDIPHCKAYVNDKTKCACGICESGYSLSGDGKLCVADNIDCPNVTYCTNYIKTSTTCKCSSCESGKTLVNGIKCCANIVGCTNYNESTCKCSRCYPGYILSNGKCAVPEPECNISNCAKCSQNNICSMCDPGYYVSNGKCVKSYDSSCNVSHCEQCGKRNYCIKCDAGYYADNGSCKNEVPNCAVVAKTGTTTRCIACKFGYTINNGKCLKCDIPGCSQCSQDNVCSKCYEGFRYMNGTCKACDSGYTEYMGTCIKCNVPGCAQCQTENVCSECFVDHKFENGKCVYYPPHCWAIGSDEEGKNICLGCYPTYSLNNGYCIECNISNCAQCNKYNNCSKCNDGYILKDGMCFDDTSKDYCYHINENSTSKKKCVIKSDFKVSKDECVGANGYWREEPSCPYEYKTISCNYKFTESNKKSSEKAYSSPNIACISKGYSEAVYTNCYTKKYFLGLITVGKGKVICRKTK